MNAFYIRNAEEYINLTKIANRVTNEKDSTLQKASKLSRYCKETIAFPRVMPEDRAWYDASAYESLEKWKIGNCLNYARALIGLVNVIGVEGRIVWISGKTDDYEEVQGHAICELNINDKWILFDAMYGVPFLEKNDPETPSAYECWKNPDLYIDAINPKYYGHSRKFWKQIWSDLRIQSGKNMAEIGEQLFLETWYSGTSFIPPTIIKEDWWYTVFRAKILTATDEDLPVLYDQLYQEYLCKEKGHTPHENAVPIQVNDGEVTISNVANSYSFIRILIKQFTNKAKILELGCGGSSFPYILTTDGYDVTAIDIRQNVVENQRCHIRFLPEQFDGKLRFDCSLAENLPYEDEAFNIIVGVDFIEHMRDIDRMLRECVRVLKKGGKMFFSTPISGLGWSPGHLYNFTKEMLENIFLSHGLKTNFYYERYYWRDITPNIIIVEATK